jgi:ribosomal-protein-alanine N-acetyltransferase
MSHRLAGYIVGRMGADELHINNVAVRDIYRRRGIGRALLNRILEAGKGVGVPCAFLELRAGNDAALALYKESGFQVTSRRTRYYTDPVEDALVMTVQLVQSA